MTQGDPRGARKREVGVEKQHNRKVRRYASPTLAVGGPRQPHPSPTRDSVHRSRLMRRAVTVVVTVAVENRPKLARSGDTRKENPSASPQLTEGPAIRRTPSWPPPCVTCVRRWRRSSAAPGTTSP